MVLPRATISLGSSALAYVEIFKPTRLGIFLVALFTYHGKKEKKMVLVGRRKSQQEQEQVRSAAAI
jgi:hypothetical protein